MIQKLTRLAAVVTAAAAVAVMSGCSDTSWAIKINGAKIPTGLYVYQIITDVNSYISYYGSSVDWTQKDGNTTVEQEVINHAIETSKQLYAIEQLCKKEKVTLSSSEKTSADSQANNAYTTNTNSFTKNGVSLTSINRYYEDTSLAQKLYTHYYGANGTKKVSDAVIDKYSADYVRVKHIFFNTNDSSNKALTGANRQKVTDKANSIFAQVQKDPSKFDTLMSKNTEDTTGLSKYPDGYTFKKNDTQYVKEFVQAANSMKIGEIRLVKSSLGYHIMEKLALDKNTMSSQYYQEQYTNLFTVEEKNYKVEQNKNTIANYSPKNVSK